MENHQQLISKNQWAITWLKLFKRSQRLFYFYIFVLIGFLMINQLFMLLVIPKGLGAIFFVSYILLVITSLNRCFKAQMNQVGMSCPHCSLTPVSLQSFKNELNGSTCCECRQNKFKQADSINASLKEPIQKQIFLFKTATLLMPVLLVVFVFSFFKEVNAQVFLAFIATLFSFSFLLQMALKRRALKHGIHCESCGFAPNNMPEYWGVESLGVCMKCESPLGQNESTAS